MSTNKQPFWKSKTLDEMTSQEWEALCDRCGRCCLVKLEDEDTGDIHLTRLACALFDRKSCQCRDYPNRRQKMPDCLSIDLEAVRSLTWLPDTCAYRIVDRGEDLPWWHHLVSGSRETVHEAGISVGRWCRSERGVAVDDLWKYIIDDYKSSK